MVTMQTIINSPLLLTLVIGGLLYITAFSVLYLIKARKRCLELGITNDEINTALRTALLAYDNGNPQVPMYLRLYSSESRFDDMLRTFGLEPPCRYETPMSLRKKLRLKSVCSEKPKA